MNVKTWIPLVLAVALGAVALVVAKKAFNSGGKGGDAGNTVTVIIAKRDVDVGRALVEDDLLEKKVVADTVPGRSFASIKELVGRTVTTPIVKGQPVLDPLLAPSGSGAGIQGLIEPGMRAITVEVNEFTGLAGLLMPNSRVDVIAAMRDDKANQQVSRTILQNIRVLAIGQQLGTAPTAPDGQRPPPSNNVTLLVDQKQAQTLQLACQGGRPWLVLRSPRDDKEESPEGTTMGQVLGTGHGPVGLMPLTTQPSTAGVAIGAGPATTQPSLPPAPRVWVTKIISGGVESRVTFQVPSASAEPTPQQQTTTAGTSTEPIDPRDPLTSGNGAAGKRDPFEPQNTPADPTIAGTDEGDK